MLIIVVCGIKDMPEYKLAYIMQVSSFPMGTSIKVFLSEGSSLAIGNKIKQLLPNVEEIRQGKIKTLVEPLIKPDNNFIFIESAKDKSKYEGVKQEIRFRKGHIFTYITQ